MYSPKLPAIVVALLCSQVGRGAIDLLAECGDNCTQHSWLSSLMVTVISRSFCS